MCSSNLLRHDGQAGHAGEGDERSDDHHVADADAVGEGAGGEAGDHDAYAVGDEVDAGLEGVEAEGALEEEDHVVGDGVADEGHEGAAEGREGEGAVHEDAGGNEGVRGVELVDDEDQAHDDAGDDEADERLRLGEHRVRDNGLDHCDEEKDEACAVCEGAEVVEAAGVLGQGVG